MIHAVETTSLAQAIMTTSRSKPKATRARPPVPHFGGGQTSGARAPSRLAN
jgi:hypothetical protein